MLKIKNIKSFPIFITPTAKYIGLGIVCVVILAFSNKKHPFYLGMTELLYKPATKELQISVRLFSNDLEDALSKQEGRKIDLINPKNKPQADSILLNYVYTHLAMVYNKKKINPNYLGYEKEEESIWIYFELKNMVAPNLVSITNTLLYEMFVAQTHIIRVKNGEHIESKKITNPENKADFNF